MRETFARVVPDVPILEGTGEDLPLADASCAAVVAAQSFHWMASPCCVTEFARVLRPGGVLALLWNTRDESVPWVAALEKEVIGPAYGTWPSVPRQQTGAWRLPLAAASGTLFGPLEERRFQNEPDTLHLLSANELLNRVLSLSVVAAGGPDARTAAARGVQRLLATHPDLRGGSGDGGDGKVELPHVAEVYWCVRL
ncbi:unnamed protein product [Phaeothamnion confervicola]